VQELSDKGLKVASAEVVYSGVENGLPDSGRNSEPRDDGRGGRRRRVPDFIETSDASGYGAMPYLGEGAEVTEYVA